MSPGLAPSDPLPGRILADRYEILDRLGEGAMGVVYKARHVKVGRLFAVKVLHPRMLQDPKVLRRFEREAELAGRLHHPNVIGVVDVGEVDGTRYMVMDFAEGPDLAKLLDEAPMPPERIIRLVRQMLEGLYHAHEQGLIHRDFKPENVIIERDSHGAELPRIVDFGIALLREGGGSFDGKGRLTTTGLVLGTPHYMAPEQAVADPIDHRIDLFALGIVIYEMLSGRLPFDGSGAEVARANLLVDPPPIHQRVPHLEVDPLLEAFAHRLMAKKRTARPATAKVARELLDRIEHDRAEAARQLGVPVAKSGRAAVTEPVVVQDDDPTSQVDVNGATVRMKQTPRHAAPVALTTGPSQAAHRAMPGAPAAPDGERVSSEGDVVPPATGAPEGGFVPPAPISPTMMYAATLPPPPGGYGLPRRPPHRDTALRTPLGWQTASLPGRRRSWLIGGAVGGMLAIVAAAVLTRTLTKGDGEPSSGDRVAIPGSAAAAPGAATDAPSAPSPAVSPSPPGDPGPAIDEARLSGNQPGAPAPDLRGDGRRTPPASIRPRDQSSERVPRAGNTAAVPDPAPRRVRDREPEVHEPEVRESDAAAPARPPAAPHEARPTRPEPPRSEGPPPPGISTAELGKLFDAVKADIEQLPEASRRDLLDQLVMLNIMRAMRGSQQALDDAAAQLWKLRQQMRDRKAGR
jgi:serine/threonine protein kinase